MNQREENFLKIVKGAYNKFKTRVYYDNNLIMYKQQIIEFEEFGFDKKLINLAKFMSNKFSNKSFNENLIRGIGFYPVMKKFEEDKLSLNYVIKAPIEVHILDTIWTIIISTNIEQLKTNEYTYANRIDFNRLYKDKKNLLNNVDWDNGFLFQTYSNGYNWWIDKTIESIKDNIYIYDNVSLVCADFKRYFYSVNNPIEVTKKYYDSGNTITTLISELLSKVYDKYTLILKKYTEKIEIQNQILPIGFASSKILSNLYLHEFDERIGKLENVQFYGRYVDDIMIVFSKQITEKDAKDLIIENLKALNISNLKLSEGKTKSHYLHFTKYNYVIQLKKFHIYLDDKNNDGYYDHDSEEDSSFRTYINFEKQKLNNGYQDQIKNTESSLKNLELNTMLIYMNYIFNKSTFNNKTIVEIINKIKSYISESTHTKYSNLKEIYQWLSIYDDEETMSMSIYEDIRSKIKERTYNKIAEVKKNKLDEIRNTLVKSYLLYNDLSVAYSNNTNITSPLITSLRKNLRNSKQARKKSLIDDFFESIDMYDDNKYEFHKEYFRDNLSYIHLSELLIYDQLVNVFHEKNKSFNSSIIDFHQLNNQPYKDVVKITKSKFNNQYDYINIETVNEKQSEKNSYVVSHPNINLDENDHKVLGDYSKKPTFEETVGLISYFVLAESHKSNLIIFPELHIYRDWVGTILKLSRFLNINITFGLQSTIYKKKLYNILVSVYSYKDVNKYNCSIATLREKNFYSHIEKRWCDDEKVICKDPETTINFLVRNKGVNYSDYLCFEATDIWMRSIFKNRVDLIQLPMLNRDTKYFDNIIRSLSRDLSCCVVTTNSATWGNSSIILPKSSKTNILTDFRGGFNSYFVSSKVPLYDLIKYNLYNIQPDVDKDNKFKDYPANFKKSV